MAAVGLIIALLTYMRTCRASKQQQTVMPPQAKVIVVSAPAVVQTSNSNHIIVIDNTQAPVDIHNQYATADGLEETTDSIADSSLSSYAIDYSIEEPRTFNNAPDQNPYNIPQQTKDFAQEPAPPISAYQF